MTCPTHLVRARFRVALPILLLLATVARAGDVHVVAADADAFDVEAIIAAAADGDTLLFEPGGALSYVEVDGKALALVGDGEPRAQIAQLVVRNLPAGLPVIVRGLWVRGSELGVQGPAGRPALSVLDCDGAVLIEDCALTLGVQGFQPAVPGAAALYAEHAASVSVNGCELLGVQGNTSLCDPFFGGAPGGPGGPALDAVDARVFVSASALAGGQGGTGQLCDGGPGAPGVRADSDSHVVLHGSSVSGGDGGSGALSNEGEAGPGLALAPGGLVWRVETDFAGGDGFSGLAPDIDAPGGGVTHFVNTHARALSVTAPLREGEAGAFGITGRQGDWIAILWSFQADWQPFFFYKGALLPSEPLFGPILLGPNPQPDGVTWVVPITAPDMPAGIDGQFALMQALVQDPDSFQLVFTAATNYVLLSDGF